MGGGQRRRIMYFVALQGRPRPRARSSDPGSMSLRHRAPELNHGPAMSAGSLDVQARPHFAGLSAGFIFADNAGGSQVCSPSSPLDRELITVFGSV